MSAPRTSPARQTSLREHNLALVLGEVADRGPATRARIAAATGLTKATVSSLVDTLVAARLLDERGLDAGAVGRPGQSLGLGARGPVGIGLEVNVDYLATCTVGLAGSVVGREVVTGDLRGVDVEAVLARAAGLLRRAADGAREAGVPVAGVAVAVPGLVDSADQVLRLAPNLGWRDVDVLAHLRRLAGAALTAASPGGAHPDLRLGNEADLGALAELWCGGHDDGAGGRLDTFVHVSGEIGVGAGLVLDGRPLTGRRGFSGEIGHLTVADGPDCACGSSGCLERLAGQEAILRRAGLASEPGTAIGRPEGPLGELVARAAAGRPDAVEAVEAAGTVLGRGISAILNLVDVGTVVLGGIYAPLSPWLRGPVERELARRVLAAPWEPPRVLVSGLGGEAAVRGAALSVVRTVIADPAAYLARTPAG
ncbi:ROK family protein [Kineosporia sp. R_H_3]|uniref:ROK family protein n=1 Tax=Kineosporia sp. R_H_3 TaxID=1961848 RepID=UPI000B4AB087|nr:ROK family protein [Kineosporia sp. R_H_3]